MAFPLELVTMLGSAGVGGILKIIGLLIENNKQKNLAMMQAMSKDGELVKQAREYDNKGFQWTRRILALIITFSVILWPSIVPVFWPHIDIVYGYPQMTDGFLWFGGKEVIEWAFFSTSIVITPLQTHLMSAIAGLYFGASSVRGK